MADTARPQTPSRKLFKPSAKTRTPPVRKQRVSSSTPQSAQSGTRSPEPSPSPALFRSSGTAPKLVRKASSHAPTTPSKPAVEDVVRSTPLAPLTSKLDFTDRSDYAPSEASGYTPIGLIDNDVLTPTDTVSRSADASEALSREASEAMTGAAGGAPDQGSTTTGSLNEKSETVKNASPRSSQQTPEPKQAREQTEIESKAATSPADNSSGDEASTVDAPSEPIDLARYFLDQGNPQMTEFIKALIAPQQDPASAIVDALGTPKDTKADVADKVRDLADESVDSNEPGVEDSDSKESRNVDSTTSVPASTARGLPKPKEAPLADQTNEAVNGFPEVSRDPLDELPTANDLIGDSVEAEDTQKTAQDSAGQASDSVAASPDISTEPKEKQANARKPSSVSPSTEDSAPDTVGDTADKPRESISGFPDVSQNPIDELPTNDDLVTDPANSTQDATKARLPTVHEAQESEPATSSDVGSEVENLPSRAAQSSQEKEGVAEKHLNNKIGAPDTQGITEGQDIAGDGTGKALDLKDSIRSHDQDSGGTATDLDDTSEQPVAKDDLPIADNSDQTLNGKAIGENSQKSPTNEDSFGQLTGAGGAPKPSPEATRLTNGTENAIMSPPKDGSKAKEPQGSSTPQGTNQSRGSGGGIQAKADNMGKPARINRRVDIPLPRPEKSSSSRPSMQMPDVDKLRNTDELPNVNGLEDPPEEFLDPSVHSPQQPTAHISPVPKISKVNPITNEPPPDLARLANGLGGHTVDDVGNIVDESGKVLGHATGDLPSMIGKKVAGNGEVYGDSGELIGFVTENFTGHPPPATDAAQTNSIAATPMPGGLRIDTDGNILDGSGNVIGKMHNKPGDPTKTLSFPTGSSKEPPKTASQGEEEKPNGEKPRAKFDEGAIPADIFLDVKSTPDGIQLTIRIPTIFKQESRETTS